MTLTLLHRCEERISLCDEAISLFHTVRELASQGSQ